MSFSFDSIGFLQGVINPPTPTQNITSAAIFKSAGNHLGGADLLKVENNVAVTKHKIDTNIIYADGSGQVRSYHARDVTDSVYTSSQESAAPPMEWWALISVYIASTGISRVYTADITNGGGIEEVTYGTQTQGSGNPSVDGVNAFIGDSFAGLISRPFLLYDAATNQQLNDYVLKGTIPSGCEFALPLISDINDISSNNRIFSNSGASLASEEPPFQQTAINEPSMYIFRSGQLIPVKAYAGHEFI